MRDLESDGTGAVRTTSKKFGVTPQTIRNRANKVGGKRKASQTITIDDKTRVKRLRFVQKWLDADFKTWNWVDDKPFLFPPQAHNNKFYWRANKSSKKVPKFKNVKHQSCIQMFVADL